MEKDEDRELEPLKMDVLGRLRMEVKIKEIKVKMSLD